MELLLVVVIFLLAALTLGLFYCVARVAASDELDARGIGKRGERQ